MTLFCCVTHPPTTTQTFLSNQTSNWAQIFTVDSPDLQNSIKDCDKVESNSSMNLLYSFQWPTQTWSAWWSSSRTQTWHCMFEHRLGTSGTPSYSSHQSWFSCWISSVCHYKFLRKKSIRPKKKIINVYRRLATSLTYFGDLRLTTSDTNMSGNQISSTTSGLTLAYVPIGSSNSKCAKFGEILSSFQNNLNVISKL